MMSINLVSIVMVFVIGLYFLHDIWQNTIARKVMMLIACIVIMSLSIGYRAKSVALYECRYDVASLVYDIDHFND